MNKATILYSLFVSAILLTSCGKEPSSGNYRLPAEFEESANIQFIWTSDFYEIIPEVAAAISQKDRVVLYTDVKNDNPEAVKTILRKHNANLQNIKLAEMENKPQNAWLRDYGPVYLVNDKGDKKIMVFKYFGRTQTFTPRVAEMEGCKLVESNINSTGGCREVNGKGTLILVESHELEENRHISKEEIEQAYLSDLNLKNIIWLKKGIPQDDSERNGTIYQNVYPSGVNGHVDEFCRFANDSTILISYVTEEEAQRHPVLEEAKKRLDENYNILVNSADQDGNKFNVIKVPFAPLQIIPQSSAGGNKYVASVTSYLNFIITNSYIILPSYSESANEQNQEEYAAREQEVENLFKQVFPDREIRKIQSFHLNRFSGGLHCISINEPKNISADR